VSAADDLAAAYVAWRDMQERHNEGRAYSDWRHEGKRTIPEELARQEERNNVLGKLGAAERAYRLEIGQVVR
jgi:hypothetical protein